MKHAQLEHRGDSIPLPRGRHVIGRGLRCRLRFNDSAVSRRHVRLEVTRDEVTAVDLESTNGTLVNGERLDAVRRLVDGDVLRIGSREIRVTIADEDEYDEEATETRSGDSWPGLAGDLDATPAGGLKALDTSSVEIHDQLPAEHTCPRCRSQVPIDQASCSSCGYEWPAGRPTSVTQRIRLDASERRRAPRLEVAIPVIYASEWLSVDAVARDVSLSGLFIGSDLLDEVETPCRVTLLADGWQALTFDGVVRRVVQAQAGEGGRPPGMGIEFNWRDDERRVSLQGLLERLER